MARSQELTNVARRLVTWHLDATLRPGQALCGSRIARGNPQPTKDRSRVNCVRCRRIAGIKEI